MKNVILLKTDESNLQGVIRYAKHATDGPPWQIRRGDLILIQKDAKHGKEPLAVASMEFVHCYRDNKCESIKIWNHSWRYIIQGKNLTQ